MSPRLWSVGERAQAQYEALREAALSGERVESLAAARFARRGLAGLIDWPDAERCYSAVVLGAERPRWTPHSDPRLDALANGYELLLRLCAQAEIAERARR